ncbi:MAG TPA: hypothetical protein VLE43_06800 [Candidatus Saccharimonadia bacterium]|nr:hypothetical protein [Candidatus Saccharimonadia bacterium]
MNLPCEVMLASGSGVFDLQFVVVFLGVLALPLLPGLIMGIFALSRWKFDEFFWSSVVVLVLGICVSVWFAQGGDPFGLFPGPLRL